MIVTAVGNVYPRSGGAERNVGIVNTEAQTYWKQYLGAAEYRLAGSYLQNLERELRASIPECGHLSQVAHAVISAGGRRMRPLTTLAMCDALRGPWSDAIPLAVAVELVHTASLIHDDILDGSRQRRGQPAAHIRFGVKMAILAGDMLYFGAIEAAKPYPQAIGILNVACKALCLGEITEAHLESARLKGGSLFRAAAELGALAAGAEGEAFATAGRYGEKVGTAFQLRDDELDAGRAAHGEHLVDEACEQISDLPASAAKQLLIQLAQFAWRRPQ